MWHGKIFYGKCYLVVVWQSSTYKIVKVIKPLKKLPLRILGDFFMIIIIYFYNYYCYYFSLIHSFVHSKYFPFSNWLTCRSAGLFFTTSYRWQNFWKCLLINTIDIIHDARHLCTRLKTDGIKEMSRGSSGEKQVIFCFQYKKSRSSLFILENRKWTTFIYIYIYLRR